MRFPGQRRSSMRRTPLAIAHSRARALLGYGTLQRKGGVWREADRTLEQATMAADAAGDDLTRVKALCGLLSNLLRVGQARGGAHASRQGDGRRREAQGSSRARGGGSLRVRLGIDDDKNTKMHAACSSERSIWRSRRSEPDNLLVAGILNVLGLLDYDQGNYAGAISRYEGATEIYVKVLGPEHPYLAMIYNNIANVRTDQFELQSAADMYQRALDIKEAAVGHDHPDIAMTLDNLGLTLGELGQYDRALQASPGRSGDPRQGDAEDHPERVNSLTGMADAYLGLGQPLRAIEPLEAALKLPPPTSPLQVADAEFSLARALAASGRDGRRARDSRRKLATRIGARDDRAAGMPASSRRSRRG